MIKYLEPLEKSARCKRWKLVAGEDKAHRLSRVFHGAKREALNALDGFAEEVEAGAIVERNAETLRDYANFWLRKVAASGKIDKQTADGYRWRVNALVHVLGEKKLQSLTPRIIEDAYARMLDGDSKSGKPLSATYVSDCAVILRTILSKAAQDGLIGRNPADDAEAPKRDTKEKSALSDMEIRILLALLPTDQPCAIAVALAVTCGLRRGETVALRWQDVDIDNMVLEVARAARNDGSIKETKTKSGMRAIPMPPAMFAMLAEWRMERPGSEWIVCDLNGNPLKPNTVGVWWRNHRHEYGCDGVTLHELRHSYITALVRSGAHPRVAQELAGHSSINVAMNIYTHLTLDDKRAAVRALDL
ncbi:MAG: site-specific integrase [Eggerthellaceae bacterium]|nr:site-specific integrase [Eggerthellaceae bacterium]